MRKITPKTTRKSRKIRQENMRKTTHEKILQRRKRRKEKATIVQENGCEEWNTGPTRKSRKISQEKRGRCVSGNINLRSPFYPGSEKSHPPDLTQFPGLFQYIFHHFLIFFILRNCDYVVL